jgi:predicted nuclease with TOPRIM domain
MSNDNLGDGITPPVDGIDSGKQIKDDKAFMAIKEEKKALATKLAEAQAQLEKLNNEAKAKQEETLKQQGEYKRLWEEEQKSKAELSEKLKKKEEKELALRKIDVVMQELGVPLAKAEYWNFMDLGKIPVDEATQDIDRNIAKQVASDFMRDFPELLSKKPGKMPSDAATGSKVLTHEEWIKLPLAEKRLRLKDVKK